MGVVSCECGWTIHTLRWHPVVHLIDHYTYDCPDRPESRTTQRRKKRMQHG